MLTDLAWAQRAMAFGKATVVSESVVNNLRFPGQYYDSETDMNYNYFRDYNPSTGRYAQYDPVGFASGPNPFLYSEASPNRFIDSLGLNTIAIGTGIGSMAGPPGAIVGAVVGAVILGAVIIYYTSSSAQTGKWSCTASCNIQQIDPCANCPPRVSGSSRGRNEAEACVEAKRSATQNSPRGCYARHCQCSCSKS
jgi:type VI secretion system secreted protein VgrG